PYDTSQITLGNDDVVLNSRDWSFDGLPLPRMVASSANESSAPFVHDLYVYGTVQGQIEPDIALASTGDIDPLWYAPRGTRYALGKASNRPLGLLYDAVCMPMVT